MKKRKLITNNFDMSQIIGYVNIDEDLFTKSESNLTLSPSIVIDGKGKRHLVGFGLIPIK